MSLILNNNPIILNNKIPDRWHPLFIDYANRFRVDGGIITQGIIDYCNFWLWGMDYYGFLSRFTAKYPFQGGDGVSAQSIANFRHNLISSSYKLTPVNITAAMCTDKGYQGNGTSSYWNPGFNLTNFTLNNLHGSFYCNLTDMSGGLKNDYGMQNSSSGDSFFVRSNASPQINACVYNNTFSLPTADILGRISIIRSSSTVAGLYKNGLLLSVMTILNSFDANVNNVFLGAVNLNTSGTYAPARFSNRRYASFDFGQSFSAAEELIINRIDEAAEKILNRAA